MSVFGACRVRNKCCVRVAPHARKEGRRQPHALSTAATCCVAALLTCVCLKLANSPRVRPWTFDPPLDDDHHRKNKAAESNEYVDREEEEEESVFVFLRKSVAIYFYFTDFSIFLARLTVQ